ncbi:MAG: hypothetical protein A3J83_01040 [Elusimicrobia bacterium RIFOXYA2_FULL_40_6]|nr:MAG: hypothetical protein A3J83_01040 [Elusimicrobia bacterium RIFOXYA2_FULL_40_6]
MKEKFLSLIFCPKCKTTGFEIVYGSKAGEYGEIREGRISCNKCKNKYGITNGIVNMFFNPDPAVIKQQQVIHSADMTTQEGAGFGVSSENILKYRKQLLSLPEGDGSELFKTGSFRNVSNLAENYYDFFNKLNITGKERVLELGADSCWSTNKFAQKGCDCTAVDISGHLLSSDIYFEEYNTYFERAVMDMDALSFKENTFDLVFCSQVLHHSRDLKKLFREIFRILKPGGRLAMLSEPVLGFLFSWRKEFYGTAARKLGVNERAYTFREWTKFLKSAGFTFKADFTIHHRYNRIKKYLSFFENEPVKKLLTGSYSYPLLIMEPYMVNIIASVGEKPNHV